MVNKRLKAEKNVRLIIKFPQEIAVVFDAGSLDKNSPVQRNEIFDMREAPKGTIRMYWPSLPVESINFEIRFKTGSELPRKQSLLECSCSSDNIIGWRKKDFLVQFV